MNHIYKVVFNKATGVFIAVAEFAKAQGKSSSTVVDGANVKASLTPTVFALTALTGSMLIANPAFAVTCTISAGTVGVSTDATALACGVNATTAGAAGATALGLNASATNTNAVALGTRATTSGNKGVAIGEDSKSSNEKSIAIGASSKSEGDKSIAIGDAATATNTHSFAIGGQSNSTGMNAMAIGSNASATGNFSVALGNAANATQHHAFAAGVGSKAQSTYATAVGSEAQANGTNSFAGGRQAVAGGAQAVALGYSSAASGQSAIAMGQSANASAQNAMALGVNSVASGTSSTAVGQAAQATALSTALGAGAKANLDRSVALGAYSDVIAGVATNQATVNGITYDGFHGVLADVNKVVSVGDRQIQRVAAGQISATSGDAINGSQLYSVITQGAWELQAGGTKVGSVNFGDKVNFTSSDSTVTITPTNEPDGGSVSTLDLKVKRGAGISLDNTGGLTVATTKLDQHATNMRFSTPRGQQNSFVKADDLARHLNNVGFNLSGEAQGGSFADLTASDAEKQIRTGDPLTMIAGPNMKINQVRQGYEFSVDSKEVAYANNKATEITDPAQDGIATVSSVAKAINNSGFTLKTSAATGGQKISGSDEVINPADTVEMVAGKNLTLKQEGNGKITYATKDEVEFTKVTSGTGTNQVIIGNSGVQVGGNTYINNSGLNANNQNITNVANGTETHHAVNLSQLQEAGWKLQNNNNNISDVKKDHIVNFINGNATTVTVASDGNTTNTVQVDVAVDESTIKVVDGKLTATAVTPQTTTLNHTGGKVNTPADPDKNKFVTAENIANAINNAGFNVTAGQGVDDGSVSGQTIQLIKPSDTVTFDAGKNMKLTQENGKFTYATKDDVSFNTVTSTGVIVNNGGNLTVGAGSTVNMGDNKVTGVAKGEADTDAVNVKQLKDSQTKVIQGTNIASIDSQTDANTGATTYTVNAKGTSVSVSDKLTVTPTPKDGNITDYAIDLSQDTKNSLANADSAVQSFTTSVNGVMAETINKTNTDVNFVNGNVTTARNDNGNITFDVNVDGNTIKVDGNTIKANTTALSNTTNGTVNTPANPSALATAGDIANAINNVGFNVKSAGNKAAGDQADSQLIKAGDEVSFNAGKNLTVKRVGNEFTFATQDDVSFNSVTSNNITVPVTGGNSVVIGNNGINAGDTKITGVQAGTADTDAVNVSQLNSQVAASKEVVKSTDKSVIVTESEDPTTKAKTFDVAVNTDNTTITKGADGKITAKTTTLNTNPDGTAKAGDTTSLVTGDQVANAINNAGLSFSGDVAENANNKFVRTNQQETKIVGGVTDKAKLTDNNIGVVSNGTDTLTVKLAKDITLDSVTTGNTTINTNGMTITNADPAKTVSLTNTGLNNGGNKIVNVAAGTNDTDAVNVSQLKDAQAKASTEVTGTGLATVTSRTGANGQTIYNVEVAKADAPTVTRGNVTVKAGDENKVMTAGDVAAAITNSEKTSSVTAGSNAITVTKEAEDASGNTNYKVDVATDNSIGRDTDGKLTVNTDNTTIVKDPTTGAIKANTTALSNASNGTVNTPANTNVLATAGDIANAINNAGFTLKTSANGGIKESGSDELINTGKAVEMVAGKNITVKQEAGGKVTYATKDDVSFNSVTSNGVTVNNGGSLTVGANSTVNMGGNTITNLAAGVNGTDAVNVNQLNNAITNINNVTNNTNKIIGGTETSATVVNPQGVTMTDKDGNTTSIDEALTTYDAVGTDTVTSNSVVSAIKNINEQGTKYMHVNGGETSLAGTRGTNIEQSQANGAKSVAIGYKTQANGANSVSMGNETVAGGAQSIAIGDKAQANGTQSIAIGTGNIVAGNHSGAIGDPSIIDANNSYSVGNHNTLATGADNSFVLGNNVNISVANATALGNATGVTQANGVALGTNSVADRAGFTATSAVTTQITSTAANQVYVMQGATAADQQAVLDTANNTLAAVSVGSASQNRQITNVAAGSLDDDAVNVAQLRSVTGALGNNITNINGQINQLGNQINDVSDRADAGTASAMAGAGLPQAYLPGKSMVAVAGSTYRGKQGYAVGFSAISDGGNWIVKGYVSGNSRGHFGATVGAGYQW